MHTHHIHKCVYSSIHTSQPPHTEFIEQACTCPHIYPTYSYTLHTHMHTHTHTCTHTCSPHSRIPVAGNFYMLTVLHPMLCHPSAVLPWPHHTCAHLMAGVSEAESGSVLSGWARASYMALPSGARAERLVPALGDIPVKPARDAVGPRAV